MRAPLVSPQRVDVLRPWPPLLATAGAGYVSTTHAHHAMHVVVARSGTLRVREGNKAAVTVHGVVTAPDVAHSIDGASADVVLVFVDPESDAGERLLVGLRGVRILSAQECEAFLVGLAPSASPEEVMRWAGTAMDRFAGSFEGSDAENVRRMHPRVRRLLRALLAMPADTDTSLGALASLTGLSESRLLHVFRESVGIPLRPYLLWLKLQRAVVAFSQGASLTEAAHQAGFSDSAHLSRTFRRMFGMPASELRRAITRS